MEVRVIKQLYKKSEKPIEIMDEKGGIKKMTQIIREKSGTMEFMCDSDFFKRQLAGNPDYSLVKSKGKLETETEPEESEGDEEVSKKSGKRGKAAE